MRTIKIKVTGVESVVSEDYFNNYKNDGWFTEIVPPVSVDTTHAPLVTKKPVTRRTKANTKV